MIKSALRISSLVVSPTNVVNAPRVFNSGRGLFYEETGDTEEEVLTELETGLEKARSMRDWNFTTENKYKTIQLDGAESHGSCVVATVGDAQNLLE